jgi:hypothetical protein
MSIEAKVRDILKGVKKKKHHKVDTVKQTDVDNVVIVIGTGGLFYHSVGLLSNFAHQRGDTPFLLLDHDLIEHRNRFRQWAGNEKQPKVELAGIALTALQQLKTFSVVQKLVKPKDLWEGKIQQGFWNSFKPKNIWLFSFPDNHIARQASHLSAIELHKKFEVPVHEITAGNTNDDGYAYGTMHLDGKIENDWTVRHGDIIREAELEKKNVAQPMPCMKMGEQSSFSNALTAYCIWMLAEYMVRREPVSEVLWNREETGNVVIRERKVKTDGGSGKTEKGKDADKVQAKG